MEEIIEVCSSRISADKKYKNTHKRAICKITKNKITAGIKTKDHFVMAASENKTVLYSVRKLPSTNQNHTETSQSVCFANDWLVSTQHKPLPKGIRKQTFMGHAKA